MKVGLFGGTFNPVHNGHIAIAESFLKSGYMDELWILLTPNSPHKADYEPADYEIRKEMLVGSFRNKKIKILTVEKDLPRPNYTFKTIRYLKKIHPEIEFLYCIGEDSLTNIHLWKNYKELLAEVDLLVARRPGTGDLPVEEDILKHARFVQHEPLAVSSSEVRNRISTGKPVDNLLPKAVLEIIQKHQLYR